MKIIVKERSDDYYANLEGHPEIWGTGQSIVAAIGDVILSHRKVFDLVIETETKANGTEIIS